MQEDIKISYNQFHAQVSGVTNAPLRVLEESTVCWSKMHTQTTSHIQKQSTADTFVLLPWINNAKTSANGSHIQVCLPKYELISISWNCLTKSSVLTFKFQNVPQITSFKEFKTHNKLVHKIQRAINAKKIEIIKNKCKKAFTYFNRICIA